MLRALKPARIPNQVFVSTIQKFRYSTQGNIVSPDLCDDILRRLAPSLNRHVGCTIIDVNPGIGLWSSKVHQILKPKTHFLVSTSDCPPTPDLRVLLDVPDSRYKYASLEDFNLYNLELFYAKGYLPKPIELEDSQEKGRNDSLLLLVNTGYAVKMKGLSKRKKDTSVSQWHCLNYFRGLQESSQIHLNGGVRMLMWMADEEKLFVVPRQITHRRRVGIMGELTCHVEEIAGGSDDLQLKLRDHKIDYKSYLSTAKRMENEGIQLTLNRLDKVPRQIQEAKAKGNDSSSDTEILEPFPDSAFQDRRAWQKELRMLEDDFANGVFRRREVEGPGGKLGRYEKLKLSPLYKRLVYLQRNLQGQKAASDLINDLVHEQEKIDSMDFDIRRSPLIDEGEREKKVKALNIRIEKFEERISSSPPTALRRFQTLTDERRAFSTDPPILLWDQRTVEPIIVQSQEFLPLEKPLALVDFQPKRSRNLLDPTQRLFLEAMLKVFYISPSQKLTTALESMAPGASDALIPKVSSLNNLSVNVHDLRVQIIPSDSLNELAIAWSKWPFRPTRAELLTNIPTLYEPSDRIYK